MNLAASSYLTLGAPVAGFLMLALGGTRIPERIAGWLGSLAILVAFAGAISAYASGEHVGASRAHDTVHLARCRQLPHRLSTCTSTGSRTS